MKFCPDCGSEVRLEIPAGDNRMRHVCAQCAAIHYHNPRIITGCLPVYGEQVLLCKRAIEPRLGYWTLPAGFLELGESIAEGAARETREEADAQVDIQSLYCLFNLPHIGQVYTMHLATLSEPVFAERTDESLEIRLFHRDEIPWQELAFRTMWRTLHHYFEDRSSGHFPLHIEDIGPL
ncbi:MAG: NUDIX hydrolase [Pseudomonadales bacterium]|nr:NUDIX hydrolase [Pseudomonadales bacterium]